MSKIKGWEKTGEDAWRRVVDDRTTHTLQVAYHPDLKTYVTIIHFVEHNFDKPLNKSFYNKKDAVEYAIDYMKSFPKGRWRFE